MRAAGLLPGHHMESHYAQRWDQRDDFASSNRVDLGDCGEDEQGIFLRQHPMIMLTTEPDLWEPLTEWQYGIRDMTPTQIDTMSNLEAEARVVLLSADSREQLRRTKGPGNG